MSTQLRTLLLADDRRGHTGNLLAHISAYRRYSRHHVSVFNPRDVPHSRFLDINAFDVVVVHYSLVVTSDSYVPPFLREQIAAFDGLKLQFLQDEYRWVDEITTCMRRLGIDVLFSIVPEREFEHLYGDRLPNTRIVPTLAGFVPDSIVGRQSPPVEARPVDIGYRGRIVPYWLGSLSQEKAWIGTGVRGRAEAAGFRCDISSSENERIYGRSWERFLRSCKSMLGTESGASIADFDGSIETATLAYLAEHPDATFADVHDAILWPYEGNVRINVPSPRIFESAAFRTAMILFPGEYGDVVLPEDHYLPLEKDFSNLPDVLERLGNTAEIRSMTERAYADIVASGRYSLRNEVATFDSIIDELGASRAARGRSQLHLARLERPLRTGSVAGYDLRDPIRAGVWTVTMIRLLARSRELRRVLAATVVDTRLRKSVRLRRLFADLLRLGIVRRAQEGRPLTVERFFVVPRIDETNSSVLLVSTARRPHRLGPLDPDDVAPREDVRTLLWDNRAIGTGMHVRFFGRIVGLRIGYHGHLGLYHFSALETVASRRPDVVAAALTTLPFTRKRRRRLLRVAAYVILSREHYRSLSRYLRPSDGLLRPRFLSVALLRSPRNYIAKAGLSVRAIVEDPALRRIALLGLTNRTIHATAGRTSVFEDIVKLNVLREAIAGAIPQIGCVEVRQSAEELTFAARRDRNGSKPRPIDRNLVPQRVVWDNCDIGRRLPIPTRLHHSLFLSFEPTGQHEFRILEAMFQQEPHLVWDAIEGSRKRRRHLLSNAADVILLRRSYRSLSRFLGQRDGRLRLRFLSVALLRSPRNYIAKAGLSVRAIVEDPALRRIALLGLTNRTIHATAGRTSVFEDIVKLNVLREAIAGAIPQIGCVEVRQSAEELTFAARRDRNGSKPRPIDRNLVPQRVVWDNCDIGRRLPIPTRLHHSLFLSFEPTGQHEFRILEAMFQQEPHLVWDAIEGKSS